MSARSSATTNSNRWSTRQLVTMALMAAIGVILSFIEFPLLPAVPFLKFDASNMTALVAGFAYSPGAGVVVGIVIAIIHGLMMGDFPGMAMNILVVTLFVLPAAIMYKKGGTTKHAIIGLVLSVIFALIGAIIGNLIITPFYMGVPIDAVVGMIIPILVPFNLIKGILNAVLTMVVYKSIGKLIA